MDPLSTTASIISITTAALQSAQFLANTINNIKEAPDIVQAINTDLQAVQPVLQNLAKALQDGPSRIVLSNQIKHAINNCDRACRAFQSQLEHWVERSSEDKIFWMDRWRIGLFGPERIKTFRGQLSDCKGTLSVALSTATIIVASRQETLMEELKNMMLQNNEVVVRQKIIQADSGAAEIERGMQQIVGSRGSELSSESENSIQELLQELKQEQATNNAFKELCEEALSQLAYERTGQKIKSIRAKNNSTALAGFINTSGEESKISQDISDVIADNWSIAVAGVIKNFDFKDPRSGGLNGPRI